MLQDTSLDFRGSTTSGPPHSLAFAQFPRLVVFPPGALDSPAGRQQEPLDWLENIQNDECKFTAARGVSIPLTPQTSASPHDNIEQLPHQRELELYTLSSPVWSTTESGFSSPAYTLPRTPINAYPTPTLGSQDLYPYHTPPITPTQQLGGGPRVLHPTHSPLVPPATAISPSATAGTDELTRDITHDMHATRHYERSPLPEPRLSSSFSPSFPSSAYETQETGLQLTLYEPMPTHPTGLTPPLVCYGSESPSLSQHSGDWDATPHSYNLIPYGTDGQMNGPDVAAAEVQDSKDVTQNVPSSSSSANAAKKTNSVKNFACSLCSRAFARAQDMTRHVNTVHTKGKQWVCCGVPMSDAHNYKISEDAITIGPMEHGGVLMIGGCGRAFGRKDTYTKHLQSSRTQCIGNAHALYHSENMKKALRYRLDAYRYPM